MSLDSPDRRDGDSLSAVARIDEACDAFESRLKKRERPRLEDYFTPAPEKDRPALLRELLRLEIAYWGRGSDHASPAEYLGRFPSYEETILGVFAAAEPAAFAGPHLRGDGDAAADGFPHEISAREPIVPLPCVCPYERSSRLIRRPPVVRRPLPHRAAPGRGWLRPRLPGP